MSKTKIRGLGRKCREMVARIESQTQTFPAPHRGLGYWHLHLLVSQNFIDSKATPFGVRRLCVQTLIDQAQYLASVRPTGENCRVVVAVSLPEVWRSQIIVFFGDDYFENFFIRNRETQRWTSLERSSLTKRWSLALPPGFSERGYLEELREADEVFRNHLWFFGQLG